MANEFHGNLWIIDTPVPPDPPARQPTRDAKGRPVAAAAPAPRAPKPGVCEDMLRVKRIRYVGGQTGEELLIHDRHGNVVWAASVFEPAFADQINTPGTGVNWDGMQVVKIGTGKLYVELM